MPDNDEVQLTAKLRLDTSEAQQQLQDVTDKANATSKATDKIALPKPLTDEVQGLFKGPKGLRNLARIARSAQGGIRGLTFGLQGLATGLGGAGGVVAIVLAILALLAKLAKGTDTMKKLKESFDAFVNMLKKTLAPVIALLGEIFIDLMNDITELLEPILQIATSILKPVLNIISKLIKYLEPLVKLLTNVLTLVAKIVDAVSEFFMTLMGGSAASTTGTDEGSLKTSLDTWETTDGETEAEKQARLAAEASQSVLDSLGILKQAFSLFTFSFDDLKTSISDLWRWLTTDTANAFKELFEKLKTIGETVWNVIKTVATTVWDSIKAKAVAVWESVKSFFEKTFSGIAKVATGVKDFASGAWNGIKGAAASVGSWIGGIFGHAQGGTLDVGAQIWGMNEQGNPEFLFNAGGRDTVVNASILEDAVASGVMKANAKSKTDNKLVVAVDKSAPAGQRELAQWLLPSLKFLLSRG